MKTRTIVSAVAAAFLATSLVSPLAFSKPEFAKKESKKCTDCHVTAGKPELKDFGKCYKEKRDVKACESAAEKK